jgi:hypothetical protein
MLPLLQQPLASMSRLTSATEPSLAFMKDTLCRHLSKRGKAACATTLGKDDTMTSQPRTFLITGASKGIGRALSVRLAGAGHRVVGLARRADP